MTVSRVVIGLLAMLAGAALFVLADHDDSPGGQLIAVLIMFSGLYYIVFKEKQNRPR